jgi:hypothetical protein
MEAVIVIALLAVCLLAPWFGTDSRLTGKPGRRGSR